MNFTDFDEIKLNLINNKNIIIKNGENQNPFKVLQDFSRPQTDPSAQHNEAPRIYPLTPSDIRRGYSGSDY